MVGPFIVEGAKTYPLIDLSYFKIPFVLVVCINWLRHGINKNKINRTSYKYSTNFFEVVHTPSFLRIVVDYGEKNAPVKNFRGMEQYDWVQNGFFTG